MKADSPDPQTDLFTRLKSKDSGHCSGEQHAKLLCMLIMVDSCEELTVNMLDRNTNHGLMVNRRHARPWEHQRRSARNRQPDKAKQTKWSGSLAAWLDAEDTEEAPR